LGVPAQWRPWLPTAVRVPMPWSPMTAHWLTGPAEAIGRSDAGNRVVIPPSYDGWVVEGQALCRKRD
jgi:hypothetical protein